MNAQLAIDFDFTSGSPINTVKLTGQNKATYDALMRGERLNCFSARETYGIGTLHSRITDVIKAMGWTRDNIKRKHINVYGNTVCEYWIEK